MHVTECVRPGLVNMFTFLFVHAAVDVSLRGRDNLLVVVRRPFSCTCGEQPEEFEFPSL